MSASWTTPEAGEIGVGRHDRVFGLACAGGAPLMAAAYLAALHGTGPSATLGLLLVFVAPAWVAVKTTPASPVSPPQRSGAAGSGVEDAARARAGALLALPRHRQQRVLFAACVPILVVPTASGLIGDGDWLAIDLLRSLLLVSAASGAFSAILLDAWSRQSLAPLRIALARTPAGQAAFTELASPAASARSSRRWIAAVVVPAVASALLMMDALSHANASIVPWLVALSTGLLSALCGGLMARELARSTQSLSREAQRLAEGDLRPGSYDPSDDELGRVACALYGTAKAFRETVAVNADAATRVEANVRRLSTALSGIARASGDQAEQLDRARQLMRDTRTQVALASDSAVQLTTAIDESSHSVLELGATGDELNATASILTAKVDAVSDSLEQMVASVKQVGSTTDQLAEASEETSSSMEEMASAMRAVDTAAATTARLSRDVVDKAEVGQAKVVQTIVGMDAIREATEAAERVIRGLGARTGEIGGILDVIEDVADETSLLALNAAIIAAQAGEQGKAFSVVADEIKELADRVLASTKEIGGLIRAVQLESENAIGAIEAGSKSVMEGVELSAEAGRTLEEITEASRESGTRIGEIVNSVREQTKAASHVVALMDRVRESAEQISAAGAEQARGNEVVYRSALTMREVAQQVRRTTEEQATGFGRIRQNVAGVRDAVEQITGVLHEQSEACSQVTGVLESVAAGSRSNEESAEGVRVAMAELSAQAERLRAGGERFSR